MRSESAADRIIHDYGDRAILVEVQTLDQVVELHRSLESTRPPGVIDIVPAARTVAITVDPHTLPLSVARSWARHAEPVGAAVDDLPPVTIDVDYSGPDLDDVARILGLTSADVIRIHSDSVWRVAFTGFAPGFGYLVTDHHRLEVPRRDTPRTTVAAGSVGLAGEFSGVYPRSSPGGWQIIGMTDATLWNPAASSPALLMPGRSVRFRRA
jgi:KipI family sensor histidine kinase inhibitor